MSGRQIEFGELEWFSTGMEISRLRSSYFMFYCAHCVPENHSPPIILTDGKSYFLFSDTPILEEYSPTLTVSTVICICEQSTRNLRHDAEAARAKTNFDLNYFE